MENGANQCAMTSPLIGRILVEKRLITLSCRPLTPVRLSAMAVPSSAPLLSCPRPVMFTQTPPAFE